MGGLGNKEIMARNIKKYMALNNKTQTDMCNILGFKMSTFSDWLHAKSYPRIDKIEMMANYFGIEKSDLIEDKSSQPEPNTLAAHFEGEEFTVEEMEEIKNFVEFVKNKRKS